ncbi:MAG: helix-turn-helix transcriptional regulator [Gemmataceae bacterium]|nr:helix-turn-helix transcriptional regulator [Gemmataceae bacterium]
MLACMAKPPTHFAGRLLALREAAGLSKYRLAELTGLTRQALGLLESGQTVPTWDTVQKLARALGVSCEAFEDPGMELPEAKPPGKAGRPPKKPADQAEGKKGKGKKGGK